MTSSGASAPSQILRQANRKLCPLFHSLFGNSPAVVASAPGRIELIGNHTDYNGGSVLGVAINRRVVVAGSCNHGGRLRLFSTSAGPLIDVPAGPDIQFTGPEAWANYPAAVWKSLGDHALPRPPGVDLLVDSDLPTGAGLSSSAALELAVALSLLRLAGDADLPPEQLASLCRYAENTHVGVPCGILDHGTCAMARDGHIVHIDCRGPQYTHVPFPAKANLWIFNTKERHALADGSYARRNQECLEAARCLGVPHLTDLKPHQLEAKVGSLPFELAKRARHIVGEHDRVRAAVSALGDADIHSVGRLLTKSHHSSRLLFENSTPTLDNLVDLLIPHPAVLGARLTGGGFGGAVVALTTDVFRQEDADRVGSEHANTCGQGPDIMKLQATRGAVVEPISIHGRQLRLTCDTASEAKAAQTCPATSPGVTGNTVTAGLKKGYPIAPDDESPWRA